MRTVSLLAVPVAMIAASVVSAAVVTQDTSQTTFDSSGWNKNSIWNPDQAPNPSNDYVNPAGYVLRTPDTDGSTFLGKSLTIRGTLALKAQNTTSQTKTVSDLRLDGGSIDNFTSGDNYTQTLLGKITVLSNSLVKASDTTRRHISFGAQVTGDAVTLSHQAGNAATVYSYTNAGNTFAGLWNVSSGTVRFTSAAAAGRGDVEVGGGTLEIQGDWTGDALTVTGGVVALAGYDWRVDSLTLMGNAVSGGTYSVAQLNTLAAGRFTGTDATLTVIPEPTSLAFVTGAVALVFSTLRPRHRRA